MAKWTLRIIWWLLLLVVIALTFVWVVLATPFFVDVRRSVVEDILSEQIGQPLIIRDDVRVVLGPTSRIFVAGVEIPSEDIADKNLAELNVLELELDLFALLDGSLDLDNLKVDGLQVYMLTKEDGSTTWTDVERDEPETVTDPDTVERESSGDLLAFLSTRTVAFTSIGLLVENDITGFDFVFDLKHLNLDQLDEGTRVGVLSEGTVNGQTFSIEGNYPRGKPFTTTADFGAVAVSFDGSPIPLADGGGFNGKLLLDTGEIGDFLEVIGLARTLEGQGNLAVDLTFHRDELKVAGLEAAVDLSEGQNFTLGGSVDDLLTASGFDIVVGGRLYPEGKPLKQAKKLKDLRLAEISAHIVSENQSVKFDDLILTTNSFDQEIKEVGPISIERLYRTEEGHLALQGVTLNAGPVEAPYITAYGDVLNLLKFKELEVVGELNAPASFVLKELGEEVADAFGGVKAEFSVDDSQGHISLNSFDAYAVDTEVWALKAHAEMGNVGKLAALKFDFDLDVQDAAQFLSALKLEEVDVGPLELTASASGQGKDFTTSLGLMAGTSRIEANVNTTVDEMRPVIKGLVFSERIDINDLKNGVAAVVQLSKIGEEEGNGKSGEKSDEPEMLPLVLPKEESEPEFQPLVLPEEDSGPKDLVSLEDLLVDTDLNIGIEIEKISGQQGVSSMSSELVAKDGKAKFGPIEASYGGGYFNVTGAMNLVETPSLLSLSGATSGWDFGEILDSVGLGIDARGKIRGRFSVTGNRASLKTYFNSMYGSASITMTQGKIATSLIELAGLGVLPWLFSAELAQGYTDITCVVAPLKINAGKVTFSSVVAETSRVQLVVRGALDWKNDAITLRAEPRPVGKPLSRSAWPFDVTGKLTKPQFKLQVGGSRVRRSDGADKMPTERKPCTPDIRQLK